LAKSFTK